MIRLDASSSSCAISDVKGVALAPRAQIPFWTMQYRKVEWRIAIPEQRMASVLQQPLFPFQVGALII